MVPVSSLLTRYCMLTMNASVHCVVAIQRAKRDMAAATTPQERAVQNGRQLALKVSLMLHHHSTIIQYCDTAVYVLLSLYVAPSCVSLYSIILVEHTLGHCVVNMLMCSELHFMLPSILH
jgi:hypothetical protein